MSDKSAIEWTDATWNPTVGCSIVSPGCTNCYAMHVAAGLERRFGSEKYSGLTKSVNGNVVWTGEVRLDEAALLQPLKWKRDRRIFVNSMSDLFHESLSDEAIDRVFAVMALCPQHTFQVLTKRSGRMRRWFAERWQPAPAQTVHFGKDRFDLPAEPEGADRHSMVHAAVDDVIDDASLGDRFLNPDNDDHWTPDGAAKCKQFAWPLPNVMLGVSCERQQEANERIPHLLATPAAARFVSLEPLLGPIDLSRFLACTGMPDCEVCEHGGAHLDWVIVGGESGKNARPMHPDWARSLRDQCAVAGVPFFFKQWGAWVPDIEAPIADKARDAVPGTIEQCGERSCFAATSPRHLLRLKRVGKKAAGRTLDGRTHDQFPGAH